MSDLSLQFEQASKKREEYLTSSLRFMTADTRGVVTLEAQADFAVIKSHAGDSARVAGYVERVEAAAVARPAVSVPFGNKM